MYEVTSLPSGTCDNTAPIPNPLASVSSKKCFDISGKPRTGAVIKVIFSFRFIKEFAAIARPMHKLTEKNCPFNWTEECETAFQKLKITLITAPHFLGETFNSCSAILSRT
jgi:hypothetical protein